MAPRAEAAAPLTARLRTGGIALALVLAAACRAPRDFGAEVPRQRPQAGMVVCEHPLAAEVGASILRRGGNAADAAFATALALAVVYPRAGNLGGGGFALWVPGDGEPAALDFRETAPTAADPALYVDAEGEPDVDRLREGALSIGVPGTPAGLWTLLARYGSKRFTPADLAQPAIELARKGFAVDANLARDLAKDEVRERLTRLPGARDLFYPGSKALAEGDWLVQPELADTLILYSERGPLSFYSGPIAQALLAEIARAAESEGLADLRGTITGEDLARYGTVWREPLRGWFRGREIVTMPPPSSGGVVLLQVLSVLAGFPLDAQRERQLELLAAESKTPGRVDPGGLDARAVHWWIEALRASFEVRAKSLGDPGFFPVPIADLLSPAWVAGCRMEIGERAGTEDLPAPPPEGQETTHLSVLDASGSALALTTTLNSSYGCGILVRGAGFLLNNTMDDFALAPGVPNQFDLVGSEANAVEGGKRPLSSMTPLVMRDGGHTVSLVVGSPGGPRIITAVLGVVLRTMVYEQSLADAVAAPRFHQQWSPSKTEFEPGWPEDLLEALRRRGHEIEISDETWGSVQAIAIAPDGSVVGASDPRRGGSAVAVPAPGREEP
jgi:gamma-glutamyltranspeptidase / glutathione hydrolase